MATTTSSMPGTKPRQIILTLDDTAVLKDVKTALRMIRGVASLTVSRKKNTYYGTPEFYSDLDAAEQDILMGKGVEVKSEQDLDALFA